MKLASPGQETAPPVIFKPLNVAVIPVNAIVLDPLN